MTEQSYENLRVTRNGAVGIIALARPSKFHALNAALLRELDRASAELGGDAAIGAIVITGGTDTKRPAFAAGADIGEMAAMDVFALRAHSAFGQAVFRRLRSRGKPVIAAVNGLALGGGCELALACHLRYAAASAFFGQPEINLGLIPGFGGSERLPALIGPAAALEMLLSGDPIDAAEAHRLGLVQRVLPDEGFLDAVVGLVQRIAAKAPLARGILLELAEERPGLTPRAAQRTESDRFGALAATADTREGLAAFLEKRAATWQGR